MQGEFFAPRGAEPDNELRLLRQKNVPQVIARRSGSVELVPTGRAVLFEECRGARVVVRAPLAGATGAGLARLVFVRCADCAVVVEAKILGTLELFECARTRVELRAACGTVEAEACRETRVEVLPPVGGARPTLVNRGCSQPFAVAAPESPESAESAELRALLAQPAPLEPVAVFFDAGAARWVQVPLELLRERDPGVVAAVRAAGRRTPPPYKYYVFEVPEWRARPDLV